MRFWPDPPEDNKPSLALFLPGQWGPSGGALRALGDPPREQDEAAGGLERCPGQSGRPVPAGPASLSWVGIGREPGSQGAREELC